MPCHFQAASSNTLFCSKCRASVLYVDYETVISSWHIQVK